MGPGADFLDLLCATGTALVRLDFSWAARLPEPAKHPFGLARVVGSKKNRRSTFQLRLSHVGSERPRNVSSKPQDYPFKVKAALRLTGRQPEASR